MKVKLELTLIKLIFTVILAILRIPAYPQSTDDVLDSFSSGMRQADIIMNIILFLLISAIVYYFVNLFSRKKGNGEKKA